MKKVSDFDYRVGLAVGLNDFKWPKQLTSGVMFYAGLRITRREFRAYIKAIDSE